MSLLEYSRMFAAPDTPTPYRITVRKLSEKEGIKEATWEVERIRIGPGYEHDAGDGFALTRSELSWLATAASLLLLDDT